MRRTFLVNDLSIVFGETDYSNKRYVYTSTDIITGEKVKLYFFTNSQTLKTLHHYRNTDYKFLITAEPKPNYSGCFQDVRLASKKVYNKFKYEYPEYCL